MSREEPAEHLSPGGAAMYRSCPNKWWQNYVERHPRKPASVEMILGSYVHRVLERVMLLEPYMRTFDEAKRIAADVWDGPDGYDIFGTLGPEVLVGQSPETMYDDMREFKWRARWCIEAFFKWYSPAEAEVYATEVDLSMELGGVPFIGYADLVTHDVLDYKTGEAPEKDKPWSAQREREKVEQPLLYAAALREQGVRVQEAHLLFLSPQGRSGWLSAEATDEALDGAVERLQATWQLTRRDLARGHAEAYTGPLCGWCDFLAVCPDGQREVRVRIRKGKNVGPGAEVVA